MTTRSAQGGQASPTRGHTGPRVPHLLVAPTRPGPGSIWFRERIAEVCADKLPDGNGPADAEAAGRTG